jgi:hypothetical protein
MSNREPATIARLRGCGRQTSAVAFRLSLSLVDFSRRCRATDCRFEPAHAY